MKLVLHYLKFDIKHWFTFFCILWGSILASMIFVLFGRRDLMNHWGGERGPDVPMLFQSGAALCRLLMILCAVALCIFAGRAASPMRDQSWNRTRPGRGWRIAAARGGFVLLLVAGPFTLAYTAELAILQFNSVTILSESAQMLALSLSSAVAILVWAFLWPGFAGILLGLCSGICLIIGLNAKKLLFHDTVAWPHPAVIMASLAIPALWGLMGRKGPRQGRGRALPGLAMGVSLVLLPGTMPLLLRTIKSLKAPEDATAGSFENNIWTVRAEGALRDRNSLDGDFRRDSFHWLLPVSMKPGAGIPVEASVMAISWRAEPDGKWSPWQPVNGILAPNPVKSESWQLMWSERGETLAPPLFKNGELRFKSQFTIQHRKSETVPGITGAFAKDDGWTFELRRNNRGQDWSTENRPFGEFQTVLRIAAFSDRSIAPAPMIQSNEAVERFYGVGQPWLVKTFSFVSLYAQRGDLPDKRLTLSYLSPRETLGLTLQVGGITSAPVAPGHETRPPKRPPNPIPGRNWSAGGTKPGPRLIAWPTDAGIPDMNASESEISLWLQNQAQKLSSENDYRRSPDPATQHRIKALVERWPRLFIEWTVRESHRQGDFFRLALIDGLPEETKDEVLQRIPESEALVEVAMARHWEAEAKASILKLIQRLDRIPEALAGFCREYRDPSFHDAMRKSFTPDEPTVHYWRSMPDLAPELPARLANPKSPSGK